MQDKMAATSGGSSSEKALSNNNSVMISSCDPISQATRPFISIIPLFLR